MAFTDKSSLKMRLPAAVLAGLAALLPALAPACVSPDPGRAAELDRARAEAREATRRADEASARAAQAEARAGRAEARARAAEAKAAGASPAPAVPAGTPPSDGAACAVCARDDEPVAVVDGRPLRRGEYKEYLLRQFGPGYLDAYVNEALIERAAAEQGVTLSEEDVTAWIEEKIQLASEHPQLKGHVNPDELRVQYRAHARTGATIERLIRARRRTDEGLRREYERRYGERRRARHILIRSSAPKGSPEDEAARKKTEAVLARLVAGEDFAEVARKESQDGSAAQGGDLGEFDRTDVVAEFGDAAFALKEGDVSVPVRSRHGWHLIQVTRVIPSSGRPFDEVRGELAAETDARVVTQDEVEELLTSLRTGASVEKKLE